MASCNAASTGPRSTPSRTAQTARGLSRRRSWALTGTPIENRPEELASLFEYLEIIPPAATPDIKQLTHLARQCILRRTKDLVMKDMPPRLDRDAVVELLAAQEPLWQPGTRSGYHALTFGHLVGEVVRRISGRTLGAFFRDEVATPLGLDFHIGLPVEHDERVAPVLPAAMPEPGEVIPSFYRAALGDPVGPPC